MDNNKASERSYEEQNLKRRESYVEKQDILKHIDYTLLKPSASWEEIQKLCEEAIALQTASVCVPPAYVRRIAKAYAGRLTICTVVGFPLGYSVTEAKAAETRQAVLDGADEIDMVINIGDVKNGMYDKVEQEIRTLREICKEQILKVIVETCYLTQEEKIAVCRAVANAGADYIKTSTGFGTAGAAAEDIVLFRENIGPHVKIKAAGGIRTREDMETFLTLGCDRIGTSSAAGLIKGEA